MRRRGLACLQSVALARGATASAAAAEACPARALVSQQSFFASSSTSSSSSSSSSSSQSSRRQQQHHHQRPRAPRAQQQRRFDAVLLDATGTLITPSEPAAEVYRHYAALHGLDPPPEPLVLQGFRRAYSAPWPSRSSEASSSSSSAPLSSSPSSSPSPSPSSPSSSSSPSSPSPSSLARFAADGRPFWRAVVAHSLGLPNPRALPAECFEDIYGHYSRPSAWKAARGAARALDKLRRGGVRVAVCSNFDSRLPGILRGLGLAELVDAVVVSGEHAGAEKPGPVLFEAAIRALEELGPAEAVSGGGGNGGGASTLPLPSSPHRFGILPSSYSSPAAAFALDRARTLVVGDDRRNDVTGGRAAGCVAWLYGSDVRSLKSLAARVLGEIDVDDEAEETESDEDEDDAAA